VTIGEDNYRRARQFIDDILRINDEHGMRSVDDSEVIECKRRTQADIRRDYAPGYR